MPAGQLRAGDKLLSLDGTPVTIQAVSEQSGEVVVYNVTVEGLHTYFAGTSRVLVHNCGGISPSDINFSQRTVSGNVEQYVRDMRAGDWDWNRSGPIRIMQQDGKWVSYDNRRLMAAQQAGLKDIPFEVVDPKAIMPGSKKTWEQAFKKRFNDRRNVDAGGAVPSGGISSQPGIKDD